MNYQKSLDSFNKEVERYTQLSKCLEQERINQLQERQRARRNQICFMIIVFSLVTLIFFDKITESKIEHKLKDLEDRFIFKMKSLLEEKYIDKTSANKIEAFTNELATRTNELATRIDLLSGNLSKALSLSSFIRKKFIYVTVDRISAQNIEYINYFLQDLRNLLHNAPYYRKELLISVYWRKLSSLTSSRPYDNLLLISQQWKKLRPDGEIHCLIKYYKGEEPTEPSLELKALFTTSHFYQYDDSRSGLIAIRKYWPAFSNVMLTNEAKLIS